MFLSQSLTLSDTEFRYPRQIAGLLYQKEPAWFLSDRRTAEVELAEGIGGSKTSQTSSFRKPISSASELFLLYIQPLGLL